MRIPMATDEDIFVRSSEVDSDDWAMTTHDHVIV